MLCFNIVLGSENVQRDCIISTLWMDLQLCKMTTAGFNSVCYCGWRQFSFVCRFLSMLHPMPLDLYWAWLSCWLREYAASVTQRHISHISSTLNLRRCMNICWQRNPRVLVQRSMIYFSTMALSETTTCVYSYINYDAVVLFQRLQHRGYKYDIVVSRYHSN